MAIPTNEEWAALSEQERARLAAEYRQENLAAQRFADDGGDAAGLGFIVDENEVAA